MDLSEIRELWRHPINDEAANIAAWDALAQYYGCSPLPEWGADPFLVQIEREVPLTKDVAVLDIGCGQGAHSIVLAQRVGDVVGVDLSPVMIERAKAKANECGLKNVSFLCGDFRNVAIERQFDLVFAHMTPAVADAAALEKMLSLAKGYCYLVKPVRRDDPVLEALYGVAGCRPQPNGFDQGMLFAFAMLWQQGYLPSLSYRPDVWDMEWSLEQAKEWYLNRFLAHHPLDEAKRTRVVAYLKGIAVNGKVKEVVHTTIATMSWRMSRG